MTSFKAQLLWDNISRGDLSAVHSMLETGHVNLEERDQNGCTFLMIASEKGAISIVRELLQAGVDPNAVDNENWNALLCASKQGHLEIVVELLDRNADIEHADMCGWTALMWACYKGNLLVVNELLDRGANCNVKADHNMTCLAWAAGRGHVEIAKLLIDKGAKINTPDKYGNSPLIWACRKGHLEIVDALLGEGANVDASGMNSWTPLLVATKGGHFDVVRSVLDQNPNVNATDKDGATALCIAAREGYHEIVNDLLVSGAYVNLVDRSGDTILINAVKGGHVDIVNALLKKYVDVDVPGQDGKTALYCAVEKGYTEIVRLLLNSNPDLEISTKDNDTPLLRAVRMRHEELVRMLLVKGAKVSASDKRGDTALHIAIRARAKRITELLLRNPRHSRLLYRLNKAGESPYSMDNHQRGILPQIHGHGNLNATDAENLLGYEIYSSALADILSEPGLITPITMGLYAKWGSGKSFLLDKLTEEMKNFTQQNITAELSWSWTMAMMLFLFNAGVGLTLGLAIQESWAWQLGLGIGLGLFPPQIAFICVIIFVTARYDFSFSNRLGAFLGRKQRLLELFLQMLFCIPKQRPVSDKQMSGGSFSVRFLFSDCTRLSSVGGEKSLAAMIGTLCEAVENEYGMVITRLFRVFKPSMGKPSSRKFKSICCIPYFLVVFIVIICLMVGIGLSVGYGIKKTLAVDILLIAFAAVVGLAILVNVYTWGQMAAALVFSQKRRVIRAAEKISELKMDGFMQKLKREVDLMSKMVTCMDCFTLDQTRLVVIVDGLDSCEQDKVLQVLDTVKSLFSDDGSPFITILAVDPHIIIKGIEQNLKSSFQDTNVNGFDYLRNVVHLPFYLQSQGIRIQQPVESHNHVSNHDMGESPSKTHRQDSSMTNVSNDSRPPGSGHRKHSRNLSASVTGVGSIAGSLPGMIYASSYDLSTSVAKNDYFSDINPRSMRRLMNIVAVTARLLRAYNIEFKWHRLAAWINLTEQWPYRLSWIIYLYEESEFVENSASLYSLYKRVMPSIPSTKDQDPLLEIDRNVRKLEASLTSKSGNFPLLNVGDLRKFLPCTINLDPYLRKLIRETQVERQQAELVTMGGLYPPPPPPPGHRDLLRHTERPPGPFSSPHRYPTAPYVPNPMYPYGIYSPQPQMPYGLQQPNFAPFYQQPPQQDQGVKSVKSPKDFFSNYKPVSLSKLSVKEVCELLSRLKGLSPDHLSQYQASLRDNNISGLVLTMCDLSELQPIINMRFGDWQLFRSAFMSLLTENTVGMDSTEDDTIRKETLRTQESIDSGSRIVMQGQSAYGRSQETRGDSMFGEKNELQKIRERRMKRNDSVVQQLSYETAILRSAVAEFVEEESEEDDEPVDMEDIDIVSDREDSGSAVQSETQETQLESGGYEITQSTDSIPTKAVFSIGSGPTSPDSERPASPVVFSFPSDTRRQSSESLDNLRIESTELSSQSYRKPGLSHFPAISHPDTPSAFKTDSHISSLSSSSRDISDPFASPFIAPYIKVLDSPRGKMGSVTNSSEFVPLLGSIQLHSSSSSSEFIPSMTATDFKARPSPLTIPPQSHDKQEPPSTVSQPALPSLFAQDSSRPLPGSSGSTSVSGGLRYPNLSHIQSPEGMHESPAGQQISTPEHHHYQQEVEPTSQLQPQGSAYDPGVPTDLSPLTDDPQDSNQSHHSGPLSALSTGIERLARPMLSHLRSHHAHQSYTDEESPSHHHRPSDHIPHENLFSQSFSTVVEMSQAMGQEAEEDNFHQKLGVAFANVEHIDDDPEDRETNV